MRIPAGAFALIVGLISVLLTNVIASMTVGPESFGLWIIGAVAFLAAGIACGATYPQTSWLSAFGVFGGIAAGVILDSVFQEVVNTKSRNLWPIDIVFWWVLGALPIYLGFALGRFLRR